MTGEHNRDGAMHTTKSPHWLRIAALFSVLQIPALRPLHKYLPPDCQFIIPFILLGILCAYISIMTSGKFLSFLTPLLSSPWILCVLLGLVAVVSFYGYPAADGLKVIMRGSDQDDALIDAGMRLIQGRNPYSSPTYLGNPISPGPGWIILLLPFTLTNCYFVVTPLVTLALALVARKISGGFLVPNLLLLFSMSSLGFWELTVVGSDLWAIGCSFQICLLMVFTGWFNVRNGWWRNIFSLATVAMVSSARVVFGFVAPLLGIFLWKRDPSSGKWFVLLSIAFLVLIHGLFYLWSPSDYTPLHLFTKSSDLLSTWACCAILITSCIIVGCWTLRCVGNDVESWSFFLWLCLFTPLSVPAFSSLVNLSYRFSDWEGGTYIFLTVPSYLCYMTLSLEKQASQELDKPAGFDLR